jgi:hypothetical protein
MSTKTAKLTKAVGNAKTKAKDGKNEKKTTVDHHLGNLIEYFDDALDQESTSSAMKKKINKWKIEAETALEKAKGKKAKRTVGPRNDPLVKVSDEFAKFLKIKKGEKIHASDIKTALNAYCHFDDEKTNKEKDESKKERKIMWGERLNPGGERDIKFKDNKKFVVLDNTLIKLFGKSYDDYKKKVKKGDVKESKEGPVITNPKYMNLLSLVKYVKHHITPIEESKKKVVPPKKTKPTNQSDEENDDSEAPSDDNKVEEESDEDNDNDNKKKKKSAKDSDEEDDEEPEKVTHKVVPKKKTPTKDESDEEEPAEEDD